MRTRAQQPRTLGRDKDGHATLHVGRVGFKREKYQLCFFERTPVRIVVRVVRLFDGGIPVQP